MATGGFDNEDCTHCAICLERFRQPKLLSCFHSFCQHCLEALAPSSAISFHCPTCRQVIVVPPGGVKDFESSTILEEELTEDSRDKPNCDACMGRHVAEYKCIACRQHYCEPCRSLHSKIAVCVHHTVYPLSEKKAMEQEMISKQKICVKHPKQEVVFYCSTCAEEICLYCKLTSHEGHLNEELLEIASKSRVHLQEKIDILRLAERQSDVFLQIAPEVKLRIESKVQQISEEIVKRANELITWVDHARTEGLRSVDQNARFLLNFIEDKIEEEHHSKNTLAASIEHATRVMEKGDRTENIGLGKKLHSVLAKMEVDRDKTLSYIRYLENLEIEEIRELNVLSLDVFLRYVGRTIVRGMKKNSQTGDQTQSEIVASAYDIKDQCISTEGPNFPLADTSLKLETSSDAKSSPENLPNANYEQIDLCISPENVSKFPRTDTDLITEELSSPTSWSQNTTKVTSTRWESISINNGNSTPVKQSKVGMNQEGTLLPLWKPSKPQTEESSYQSQIDEYIGCTSLSLAANTPKDSFSYSENKMSTVSCVCLTVKNTFWLKYKPSLNDVELLVYFDGNGIQLGKWSENIPEGNQMTTVGESLLSLNSWQWFRPDGKFGRLGNSPITSAFCSKSKLFYLVKQDISEEEQNTSEKEQYIYEDEQYKYEDEQDISEKGKGSTNYCVKRLVTTSVNPPRVFSTRVFKDTVELKGQLKAFDVSKDNKFFAFLVDQNVCVYRKDNSKTTLRTWSSCSGTYLYDMSFAFIEGNELLIFIRRENQDMTYLLCNHLEGCAIIAGHNTRLMSNLQVADRCVAFHTQERVWLWYDSGLVQTSVTHVTDSHQDNSGSAISSGFTFDASSTASSQSHFVSAKTNRR